jgi:hypothetical protein
MQYPSHRQSLAPTATDHVVGAKTDGAADDTGQLPVFDTAELASGSLAGAQQGGARS